MFGVRRARGAVPPDNYSILHIGENVNSQIIQSFRCEIVQDAQNSKYWAVPEAKASGTAQAKIKEYPQVRSCERLFVYVEPGQAPEPSRHLTPICALGGSFSNGTAKRLTPLCKRMGGVVGVVRIAPLLHTSRFRPYASLRVL